MALIQMNMFSRSLMRTVSVNVILPIDKISFSGAPEKEIKAYKTLYLLHGVLGNYTDWVTGTRIQRYAEAHDLAVVMPSGDNAFYVDQPAGNNYYGRFIGEELVEVTRKAFPLSRKREDTFIAGLSMGGFGALRNGLKYSDTFGYIASFSGAFRLEAMAASTKDDAFFLNSRSYAEACFGDLSTVLESDKNPKFLAKQLHDAGKSLPKIYMTCGEQDSLLPNNRDMAAFLETLGANVTLETWPGAHEWDFWDASILKAIHWLPVGQEALGMSSGNVGI